MADIPSYEAAVHDAASLPVMQPDKLVGRDKLLGQVYVQLKDRKHVLIHGAAGIGKTALAAALASAYTEQPGGVLWLPVHNTRLPALLVRVGRAYDVLDIANSETPLGMIGAVANTLTQHKPLVVLDGKIGADAASEFVDRCADGVNVLIVTEDNLEGDWASIPVGKLEPEQAIQMFKNIAPIDDPNVAPLLEKLEYNSFAIAVAAGAIQASKTPVERFREALPNQAGVHGQILALTASFRLMNAALQGLLLMLGATFNGEASAELLSLVAGAPLDNLTQAMNLMAQRQLVEKFTRYGEPYYRLHPITYTFTQPLLRGSGKLDELHAKVCAAVVEYTQKYSDDTDFDKLSLEMDTIMATARWTADQSDLETANQLTVALMQAEDFVTERGYVTELLELRKMSSSSVSAFPAHETQPLEPVPFAKPLDDEADEFADDDFDDEDEDEDEVYDTLPLDYIDEDESEELDFDDDEDEDESEELDDEDEQPDMLTQLPMDDEPAAPPTSEAPAPSAMPSTADLPGSPPGPRPLTLPPSAPAIPPAPPPPPPAPPTAPDTDEPAEIAALRAMLNAARAQGNKSQEAAALSQVAAAQEKAGLLEEAVDTYEDTLRAYEALGDRDNLLMTLNNLAQVNIKADNLQGAVMYAQRGADFAGQSNMPERQIDLLGTLGDAQQQLGESKAAAETYRMALDLARAGNDKGRQANMLLKLGYAHLDDNDAQAAITNWEIALTLFRELDERAGEGKALGGMGTAYGEMNRWEEALNYHRSALHIAREVKDKEEEALQLGNLGYAAVQAGKLGDGLMSYRQALHLAYEADNRDNIISAIVDVASLLVRSPRHLSIAELLVDDAITRDPADRDIQRLKERIEAEKISAEENGVEQNPVNGTAQDYAKLAYQALED